MISSTAHLRTIPTTKAQNIGPFYYRNGSKGVLFLHGFSSTAFVFKELSHQLSQKGYTCYAPLLAGHGTDLEDFSKSTWPEWCASAEKAYDELSQDCSDITVVGASFGCLIACYLATKRKLKGMVLVATPLRLNRHRLVEMGITAYRLLGIPYFQKQFGRANPYSEELSGPTMSYPKLPIASIRQLLEFNKLVISSVLQKVTVPTLIIQSRNDGMVHRSSGERLMRLLGSSKKELVWVDTPHDELHTGESRQHIFSLLCDFLTELS